MTPRQLRRRIKHFPADTPLHKELEASLQEGVGFGNAWYGSQKEHWLGWLREYSGKGAYGRSAATSTKDAAYVWNHIQCAPMLLWLAKASNVQEDRVTAAYDAALAAEPNGAARCGALRKIIPWIDMEVALKRSTKQTWWSRFTNSKGTTY